MTAPTAPRPSRKPGAKPAEPPPLEILPKATLAKLTPRQRGLQNAAQREAESAQVGESIFWNLEGRPGSAMTESENHLGEYLCRSFAQTIVIEGTEEQAFTTACRTEGGAWTPSF